MSSGIIQDHGLDKVVDQLCSMEGVECEKHSDGRVGLSISCNGKRREVFLTLAARDYLTQKNQYSALRDTLTDLGRNEGLTFVAPPLPKRPMTPQMRAAREKRKSEFDAWQDLWRSLRKAEKSLDVAYEIIQMRDYY